jgi:hypothetical protein
MQYLLLVMKMMTPLGGTVSEYSTTKNGEDCHPARDYTPRPSLIALIFPAWPHFPPR